jgi:hypothetical protein
MERTARICDNVPLFQTNFYSNPSIRPEKQEHCMTNSKPNPPHEPEPSFFHRLALAFGVFFRTVSDGKFASRVDHLRDEGETAAAPAMAPEAPVAPAAVLREVTPDAALQLLALLQRDGRLIDFTQENLASYSDADIGAAARVVHEGCRKVLREHFDIQPVRDEAEGSRITLNEGFDAASIRVTGNVVGSPPFNGSLSHRGWRVAEVKLPKLADSHDARILVPAEVEL